jgi:hypothetical protein
VVATVEVGALVPADPASDVAGRAVAVVLIRLSESWPGSVEPEGSRAAASGSIAIRLRAAHKLAEPAGEVGRRRMVEGWGRLV